ncbi:hypothetical protein JTE90_018519 [Oedothorax gibbosus]|uniref:Uncharacterized protein n=1 Tax=Oedothorax gibbosus TaxID=931172 RepID=A0AAV6UNG7_9ARAC|nr:hypothetical protein JTE90_018519 [Oedothorax gibbosus]
MVSVSSWNLLSTPIFYQGRPYITSLKISSWNAARNLMCVRGRRIKEGVARRRVPGLRVPRDKDVAHPRCGTLDPSTPWAGQDGPYPSWAPAWLFFFKFII